jgi:hypothetical protein
MKTIVMGLICALLAACTNRVTTISSISPQIQNSTPTSTRELPLLKREKTASFFQTEISRQTSTEEIYPTPNVVVTGFGVCKGDFIPGDSSPNEAWQTCFTPYDVYLVDPAGSEITFDPAGINKDDQKYWFLPIKWSNDSRFLWIGAGETTGFSPFCEQAQPYLGLYRIDTKTGLTTPTLPLSRLSYYFKFSPSGKYLAFIQNGSYLTVLNIITGQKREFKDENELSGEMIFSPDENSLAFSTQELSDFSGCLNSKLKILDFTSGEVDTYYNDPAKAPILFESWIESERINFRVFPDIYLTLSVQDKRITNTP